MVTVHTVYDPGDLTERKEQLPYKLYNVVEEPHMYLIALNSLSSCNNTSTR